MTAEGLIAFGGWLVFMGAAPLLSRRVFGNQLAEAKQSAAGLLTGCGTIAWRRLTNITKQ